MVNKLINKFNKDLLSRRGVVDNILGMTGTSQETENEICNVLNKKNYFDATKEEQKIISKFYHFLLKREVMMIELTFKYLGDKKC